MIVQELINKKDYDYISWRVTHPDMSEGIFIGSCHSINGELIPDDQDYYSSTEEVLFYEEWEDKKIGINNGLTILVPGEWISGSIKEELNNELNK